MSESKKEPRGIDWKAIFARRPDLEPPGYYETIDQLYPPEQEQTDDA